MLTHRGFSAWITVDGQPVPEYLSAVDSAANTVSCWIPSQEGQAFTVYWQDHGGKVDTCAFITLDGFVVPGRFLFGSGIAFRSGVRTSTTSERPFVFQKVDRNGADSGLQNSNQLGMIVLRIKQIERVSARPANSVQPIPPPPSGVHQGGDVCIGFGQEIPTTPQYPSTWSVKSIHGFAQASRQPSTFVTFIFRYRTPEFLVSQGIANATPSLPSSSRRNRTRRIASAPVSISEASSLATPSPSPPVSPLRDRNHYHPRVASYPEIMLTEPRAPRHRALPGEGVLVFNDPFDSKEAKQEPSP